jgi:hypothetical protein
MLLGFAGTMAVHWSDIAQWWSQAAPRAWPSAPLATIRRLLATSVPRSAADAGSAPSGSAQPGASEPPPVESGDEAALPVMLAIRTGAPSADAPGGERELDLVNNSEQPLTIAVLVAGVPKAELFAPPGTEHHLGAESGLALEPGASVTLRSSGYQDLNETVH